MGWYYVRMAVQPGRVNPDLRTGNKSADPFFISHMDACAYVQIFGDDHKIEGESNRLVYFDVGRDSRTAENPGCSQPEALTLVAAGYLS